MTESIAEETLDSILSGALRLYQPRRGYRFSVEAVLLARRLEPKRVRFVHPYAAASASTVMVEARKGGGVEVEVEPPLILFVKPGVYTDEATALLSRL